MATFIKTGFWEKLCKPCKGYKGWLNLDEFVESKIPAPAYKTYTALLTQNGSGNFVGITGGNTDIGVTYEIYESTPTAEGYDFTNIGAPNNNIGTRFIATGTTPNSWGNGNVGLSYNEGAPVVTVLENTIGNVWFTYDSPGLYYINSNSLFTLDKTYFQIVVMSSAPSFLINNLNLNFIELLPTDGDNSLNNTPIEIRVYN